MTGGVEDLPLWAEVNTARIRRNVERLRAILSPGKLLLAVVKADGYGHGAIRAAQAALAGGADWLAVARVHEGEALRQAGIAAPILLLAEPPEAGLARLVELGLVATLYTARSASLLARAARQAGREVAVHVKVDTGMHRYGVVPQAVPEFLEIVAGQPGLRLEGIWSHFAVAEDVLNPYTRHQFECFSAILGALGSRGEGLIRHLANSAGLLTFPEAHFDLVRTGIATYGIHPSPLLADRLALEPAMALKSRVGLTKTLAAGESVSYGQRFVLPRAGVVATIPCGYADGVRRGLTNVGEVLIGGRRYRIAGTVTMDHFMVDIGQGEVAPGDEVVLLGRQGAEEITAQEVATHLSTIPYEVVCGISARVPRVYLED
ncbi:MAG: alanine racemase [Actinomycetota bacterium]